ncbi:MAG: hypothetical protein ABI861_03280 [Panacibacter sp.]
MKKLILVGFFLSLLVGCTREDLAVQIVRNPLIKFDTDSSSWKADTYFFTGPATVVVYPADPSLPGVLYNRFTLQASGKDSKGNTLQLNMTFDAVDANRLTGIYKVPYTIDRGLNEVQLFSIGGTNAAFSLCPNDSTTALLAVQKQSITEKLITATFSMTLCNNRDTAQKINIKNGIITDIHY